MAQQDAAGAPSLPKEQRKSMLEAYRRISGKAHLCPPPVVYTPLFVWRLGIWTQPCWNTVSQTGPDGKTRLETVNAFLLNLYSRFALRTDNNLRALPGIFDFSADFEEEEGIRLFGSLIKNPLDEGNRETKQISDVTVQGEGQEDVRTMSVTWYGRKVTFVFEVHAECVAMTVLMDLSRPEAKLQLQPSEPKIKTDGTNIGSAQVNLRRIDEALEILDRLLHRESNDQASYARQFKILYDMPRDTLQYHLLGMDDAEADKFGVVFADFRGLIVNSPPSDQQGFFRTPGWCVKEEGGPVAGETLSSDQWQAKLQKLWPFLTATPWKGDPDRQEYSIGKLLGGRALLATALGYQPQNKKKNPLPLYYFILANGIGARQTGRLVDALSHLGTYRLAALFNIDQMYAAMPVLTATENLVRETFGQFDKVFQDEQAEPRAKSAGSANPDRRRADVLAHNIPSIGNGLFNVAKLFTDIKDNFERRIELSRYYAGKFREGVRMLRVGRIEGFLPYDKFVERRLGAAYGLVDLVAARHQRIRTNLDILRQTEIALQSRLAEDQMAQSQKATEQSQKATEQSQKATEKLQATLLKLQVTAEVLLFAVLIPYYLGEVLLEKVFRIENNGWLERRAGLLWLAVWAASATLANSRVRDFVWNSLKRPRAAFANYNLLPPLARWHLTICASTTGIFVLAALHR